MKKLCLALVAVVALAGLACLGTPLADACPPAAQVSYSTSYSQQAVYAVPLAAVYVTPYVQTVQVPAAVPAAAPCPPAAPAVVPEAAPVAPAAPVSAVMPSYATVVAAAPAYSVYAASYYRQPVVQAAVVGHYGASRAVFGHQRVANRARVVVVQQQQRRGLLGRLRDRVAQRRGGGGVPASQVIIRSR